MEKKSGHKTTEFWLAVITSLVTLLNQSGFLGEFALPVESIAGIAGVVITYILGRSFVKNSEAKAEVAIAASKASADQ